MRHPILELAVVGGHDRAALADRQAGKSAAGGQLEADEGLVEAVDGGAAEHGALRVVQVAVGGVGLEQLGHLVRQPLHDRVPLEHAAQHVGGAEQSRLLRDPVAVLLEQAAETDRQAGLGRDGLEKGEIAAAPRLDFVAMGREHADHALLDDDRRRRDGARAEGAQVLEPAEARLGELRRVADIGDGDVAPLARREVRDRQHLGVVGDRLRPRRRPLRDDRQLAGLVAQADEAAARVERVTRLLHGRPEGGVEVELAPKPAGDACDQVLALQRLCERERRPRPLESHRRLRGERLHHCEVLGREGAVLVGRGHRDDGDHAATADQRHEGSALRAGLGHEPRAEALRLADVVHGEAGRVGDGARDAGRLACEVEPQVAPPVDVTPVRACEEARGLPGVVRDERQGDEADTEERGDLVEQCLRDTLDVRSSGELVRDPPQALELAVALALGHRGAASRPRPEGGADQEPDHESARGRRGALPREREAGEAETERRGQEHGQAER